MPRHSKAFSHTCTYSHSGLESPFPHSRAGPEAIPPTIRMSDDPPISPSTKAPATPEPSSAPTATGNQNLIVGLILGAVVLLLFLLILQMTSDGFGGDDPEIAELRQQLQDRKNAMRSENTPGISSGESPQELARRLSADSTRLATLVTQLQTMLSKVQSDLKMSQTTVQTLSGQLATKTGNAADNTALKQQLNAALSRASAAESQLQSLQQQFAGAPTAAQMEAVLQERDTLRSQVAQLNEKISKGGSDNPGKEPDPQPEKSGQ